MRKSSLLPTDILSRISVLQRQKDRFASQDTSNVKVEEEGAAEGGRKASAGLQVIEDRSSNLQPDEDSGRTVNYDKIVPVSKNEALAKYITKKSLSKIPMKEPVESIAALQKESANSCTTNSWQAKRKKKNSWAKIVIVARIAIMLRHETCCIRQL